MIRLVFLGRLEDAAGEAEREVAWVPTLADLLASLDPALRGARVRFAVNGALADAAAALADRDEVAFLPPVSGG